MKRSRDPWRIIDHLHLLLRVEKVEISRKEQKHLALGGMPLKCEEERRTEIKVFELAFARYFGYDEKTGKPGGTFLGPLRGTPHGDQRIYEMSIYVDTMRLRRRGRVHGLLPNYIYKAYVELLREQSATVAKRARRVTKTVRNGRITLLDAAA